MKHNILILLISVIPSVLLGGSNPKTATAVRTAKAPTIDGVLNEPEWLAAKPVTDFIQSQPDEGAPPTQKTEVRFLYDDDALYIGATMYDTDPGKIVARLARRDDEIEADNISFRIDSYNDNQTNCEFTVNAAGVKTDVLQYDDGRKEDPSWDVVWDVRTKITDVGWTAEVKIPFRVLRFSTAQQQDWGLQIVRKVSRTREQMEWILIRKSESGWTSKFGHLNGLERVLQGDNLELLPYVVGGLRAFPPTPVNGNGRTSISNIGFDAKYRPSGNFTVDATINPDFGQVEADPAVLNLTTFETFYPEKRPFFIEGGQILRFTTFGDDFGPGLFYSRRIGRSIHVPTPEKGYVVDEPNFTTILGAVKLSGKSHSGLSVGVLEALTREEHATLADSNNVQSDVVAEPRANYTLVRLRQDVWENSNVGMIATNVSRDGRLPAVTGGLDWNLRFDQSVYRLEGFWAHSRTTNLIGDNLEGSAGKIGFNKEAGLHWRWAWSTDFTSKRFNINDMGFFRRPNDVGTNLSLAYREDIPGESFLQWNVGTTYHYRNNFDGANLFNAVGVTARYVWLNWWDLNANLQADFGKYDDRETRGNGLYRRPSTMSLELEGSTDGRKTFFVEMDYLVQRDTRGATQWRVEPALEWKAASDLTLRFSFMYGEQHRQFAWADNIIDSLIAPTPTSIFAERTVTNWDFTSRGTFVFTRDLTLQIYLQLFSAKGTFGSTQRMVSEDGFVPYAYAKPDFNDLVFNSNIVLRWEYLPGSTLYLVWSQARTGSIGDYRTQFIDNAQNIFRLTSTNVFLLKISYWLSS